MKNDLVQTSLCGNVLGRRNLCYVVNNKTGNDKYKRSTEARSRNHCCRGNAVRVSYTETVFVALGNQHAGFRCHIILSSLAYPALQYFSTLPHKRHDYRGKVIEYKMCPFFLFSLPLLSENFLILRRFERGIIINVRMSSCEVHLFLPDFNEN